VLGDPAVADADPHFAACGDVAGLIEPEIAVAVRERLGDFRTVRVDDLHLGMCNRRTAVDGGIDRPRDEPFGREGVATLIGTLVVLCMSDRRGGPPQQGRVNDQRSEQYEAERQRDL